MAGATGTATFQVECACTKEGENVYVVGSADEFGAWDPSKGLRCSTTAQDFPLWTSKPVPLPVDTTDVEFKIVVRNKQNARWEHGPNHSMQLPNRSSGSNLIVQCAWGKPKVKAEVATNRLQNLSRQQPQPASSQKQPPAAPAARQRHQPSQPAAPAARRQHQPPSAAEIKVAPVRPQHDSSSKHPARDSIPCPENSQQQLSQQPSQQDELPASSKHPAVSSSQSAAAMSQQPRQQEELPAPSKQPAVSSSQPAAPAPTTPMTRRHGLNLSGDDAANDGTRIETDSDLAEDGAQAEAGYDTAEDGTQQEAGYYTPEDGAQLEAGNDPAEDEAQREEVDSDGSDDELSEMLTPAVYGRKASKEGPGPLARQISADADFMRQKSGSSIGGDSSPGVEFARQPSASSVDGADGLRSMMIRRGSRHMCINPNGQWNPEMSRTPSMMMIDLDEFQEAAESYGKELDALEERQRLNKMMRRMGSNSLLEEMSKITQYADKSKTFMLQGFNWESWRAGGGDWYGIISKKAQLLADMGFTDVWLPPCSDSVAPQGYLPSQLFNLEKSKYGSQASLESLLEELHSHGIRGLADIVVNHRCGDMQDSQGRWNQFSSGMISRPSFAGVMDWGGWAINLGDKFSDGTGQNYPGHFDGQFDAAPNIDHRNKKVQEGITTWLRWLRLQVGFDGWRFDFVKGYSAEFVGLYCKKTEPALAVGELWGDMMYDDNGLAPNQDKHRQDLVNWINATEKRCTAFDFTTKGILQEAVRHNQYWRLKDRHGKPPGLIGWMPKYAVSFLDNHDTGSTQRHWPFPDDKVLVGYAYIITHPGIPCIFWDHVMDWGDDHRRKIADLMKARQDSGIPVDAPVDIKCAENDLYLAEIGKPPVLRVALGPRDAGRTDMNYWSKGPAGNGYRIWVKTPEPPPEPDRKEAQKSFSKPPPRDASTVDQLENSVRPSKKDGFDFQPVTIDGRRISVETLQSMDATELRNLADRLRPLLAAAEKALASRS